MADRGKIHTDGSSTGGRVSYDFMRVATPQDDMRTQRSHLSANVARQSALQRSGSNIISHDLGPADPVPRKQMFGHAKRFFSHKSPSMKRDMAARHAQGPNRYFNDSPSRVNITARAAQNNGDIVNPQPAENTGPERTGKRVFAEKQRQSDHLMSANDMVTTSDSTYQRPSTSIRTMSQRTMSSDKFKNAVGLEQGPEDPQPRPSKHFHPQQDQRLNYVSESMKKVVGRIPEEPGRFLVGNRNVLGGAPDPRQRPTFNSAGMGAVMTWG